MMKKSSTHVKADDSGVSEVNVMCGAFGAPHRHICRCLLASNRIVFLLHGDVGSWIDIFSPHSDLAVW